MTSSELESPTSKSKSSRTSWQLGRRSQLVAVGCGPHHFGSSLCYWYPCHPPSFCFLLLLSYPLFVIGNPCHTLPLILVLMSPPSFVIGVFVTPYLCYWCLCYWCLCHPMPLVLVPLSPHAFVIGAFFTPCLCYSYPCHPLWFWCWYW